MRTGKNEEERSDDNSYNEYVNPEAVYFVYFHHNKNFQHVRMQPQ